MAASDPGPAEAAAGTGTGTEPGPAGAGQGALREPRPGHRADSAAQNAVPQENQKRGVQAGRGAGQVREEGDVAPAAESHAFIYPAWSNNSTTD